MKTDTIAAIATAMTSAGIGIVRISGSEKAVFIADRVFRRKGGKTLAECETHTSLIMDIFMMGKKSLMKLWASSDAWTANSYTKEDTVEIDCHGGVYVMKRILEAVIKYGARPAEPGEIYEACLFKRKNRSFTGGVCHRHHSCKK